MMSPGFSDLGLSDVTMDEMGKGRRNLSHQRSFGSVSVAPAAKNTDDTFRCQLFQGLEHIFKGIRCVGVVNVDRPVRNSREHARAAPEPIVYGRCRSVLSQAAGPALIPHQRHSEYSPDCACRRVVNQNERNPGVLRYCPGYPRNRWSLIRNGPCCLRERPVVMHG